MDSRTIDIMTAKKDGGMDLYILLFKDIDIEHSAEEQTSLLDKVENYLNYINGGEFAKEFPDAKKDRVFIKIKMYREPSEGMKAWMDKISSWVRSEGVGFSYCVEE